ncbi:peptidase S9 prolyl oligopeptidase active site domain protein [Solidesulfovibrio fructosivorans JJ]]|uniref:Peptidase S9 prolyl oligopeptidase active site domain protein n=1 Tax=Solidesulfovibrio fructosivorans JJ] TaxID=596151 RepID=E1JWL2_SOLFR|nr:S9 family peptidase [Solidesulfovibrio fructosivorans]EFL51309.1 peptidase S9 prolyl oligopeptidase active site domain protein [Solidesulfovibrio fructosivorans JJ]]
MPAAFRFRLRVALTAAVFFCVCAAPAVCSEKAFTIDDMLRVAMIDDLRLSADGRHVAFTVTRAVMDEQGGDLRSRVYVADAAKSLARPVTSEREVCEKPVFSPHGSRLAYLVQTDDTTDAVVMSLGTGHTRRLTHGRGDVLDLAFTPDGKALAMTMTMNGGSGNRETNCDADVDVLDEEGGAAGLFLLPLAGQGALRGLVTDRDVGGFVFSPDGGRIAFETTPPDAPPRGRRGNTVAGRAQPQDAAQTDIAMVDVKTGRVVPVAATADSETSPCFSPDGKWLAYVATRAPGFYYSAARVMIVPASGGAPRALAATPDARPEMLGWSADGGTIYVREIEGTGAVVLALPVSGAAPRTVSGTPRMVSQAAVSASGNALGMVLVDSDLPPEAYLTPLGRFAPKPVSAVNKEFVGYRLGKTEVVRWKAADGTVLEGLYTHPVTPGSGPPPLLVELHGGPAVAADRQYLGALNYYPLAVFSERGYALFQPNVRGSDGYGPAFRMAIKGDWGGVDFADLQSGIDALVARKLADPKRLGVMGWSYGGYLTAWTIGHTDRFAAASIGAGITDLVSQSGSMDLPDFIPLYFGGEAYERFQTLFDHSPLKYAAAIKTPTLFQHGVSDERVPFTQSLELYTALSRLGVPTKLAAYPRSGHDVTEPSLIRDLMVRNLDWFTRYVPIAPVETAFFFGDAATVPPVRENGKTGAGDRPGAGGGPCPRPGS